jgi:hypothetical protein
MSTFESRQQFNRTNADAIVDSGFGRLRDARAQPALMTFRDIVAETGDDAEGALYSQDENR